MHVWVCVELVKRRCHICEDLSFKLVANRDDAVNLCVARHIHAVIGCTVRACLLGHLMENNVTVGV